MIYHTDIDIDVYDRDIILCGLDIAYATMEHGNKVVRHPSGVYFCDIPRNPYNRNATMTYDKAENNGYFKVDILNNTLYDGIEDELQLVRLMNTEPMWELLQHREFTDKLHQLNKHHQLLRRLRPKSVEQLAMILAIIRPAKSHLQHKTWAEIEAEVWEKDSDDDSYQFKKSHAISYAVSLVVQMNKITEELKLLDQ